MKRTCRRCGKKFNVKPSLIKRGQGIYCSVECRNISPMWRKKIGALNKGRKHSPKSKGNMSRAHKGKVGEIASNWKGGTIKNADGRVLIYCPDHPYAHKKGYVLRYRLVMEAHLGRVLLPAEVVHHINGIKNDDRIENLMLFNSRREHTRHEAQLKKEAESGLY